MDFEFGIYIPPPLIPLFGIVPDKQILLLSMIIALSKNRPCTAKNEYFAGVLNMHKVKISKNLNDLKELGLIEINIDKHKGNTREIKIATEPINQNVNRGINQNVNRVLTKTLIGINQNVNRVLTKTLTPYDTIDYNKEIIKDITTAGGRKIIEEKKITEETNAQNEFSHETAKRKNGAAGGRINKNNKPSEEQICYFFKECGYSEYSELFYQKMLHNNFQDAAGKPINDWRAYALGFIEKSSKERQTEQPQEAKGGRYSNITDF